MRALKRISPLFLLLIIVSIVALHPSAQTSPPQTAPQTPPQTAPETQSASGDIQVGHPANFERPWVGREAEFEEYIRTAAVTKIDTLDLAGVGWTDRQRRVEADPPRHVQRLLGELEERGRRVRTR
jgi:hypothetical protein